MWTRKGDNRIGSSTARGLKRDKAVEIARLTGCKNFVGKREKFIFSGFVGLKPMQMQRFEDGSDCVDLGALTTARAR